MGFRFTTRPGHPTFVDLPWERPLADWRSDRLVSPVRGISRHVVRFVAYGPEVYALKELPGRLAEREYRLLRALADRSVPVVDAVGVATGRTSGGGARDGGEGAPPLDDVLITHHLHYSLPYRALFAQASLSDLWAPLLDALAQLLARAHLAGFFWGDCSLSNTLFRRDAGALAAWLVDAETGELHPSLSDGQRRHDLAIAEMNVAGELLDIAAAARQDPGREDDEPGLDPAAVAEDLRHRYEALWHELTRVEVFGAGEEWRVDERVRRLNELGFDVDELELVDVPATPAGPPAKAGHQVRLTTRVVEPGHHRRRLLQLTGLDVQENQARRLLNDILGYRAWLELRRGATVPEQVGALRWMVEVFEPTLAAVPGELRSKLEDAEIFHQILEHRWFMSERAGTDVGTAAATADYLRGVLPGARDERTVLTPEE
ncbi:MAG TPA: DUF4032 domain-containing protein [Acidimicrobiales bacterium]|nr:DUF4032 domain-containing protein [Acidimicrobiales bacterium]